MIPGLTPIGNYAVAQLPSAYSLSVPDPLQAILANPSLPKTYLVIAQPYDLSAHAITSVRFSNNGYATRPDDATLANVLFRNRLATPLNISVSVMSGGILRPTAPSFGNIELINIDGELDSILDYSWARRSISSMVGHESFRYAEFGPIFTGSVEEVTQDYELIRLRLRGYEARIQTPIQSRLYWGTGPCLQYDGTGDFVDYGNILNQGTAGNFMIEVLAASTVTGTEKTAVSDSAGGVVRGYRLYFDSTNHLVGEICDGTTTAAASVAGVAYLDGALRRFSMDVNRSTAIVTVYVDGVSVATASCAGLGTISTASSLRVGALNGGTSSWSGKIDDFRYWGRNRTATEILLDMHRELTSTEAAGTEIYTKFNEQSGTTAADASPNARTGTITGATWSNSYEGTSDLTGKPKPLAYGAPPEVRPVLLDSLNLVYQLHDRAIQAVLSVKDQGAVLTAAGDVADLYGTTVSSGQYKTDLVHGLIRLGTKPVGEVTASVQGDNVGGYISSAADITRRILSRHGGFADPAEIDIGAIARLNTANSAVCEYWAGTDPVNTDVVIGEILNSVGAWWTFSRAGLFRVQRLETPATAVSVGTLTEREVLAGGIRKISCAPPTKRQRIGYQKIYTVQKKDALAASLTESQKQYLSEEYRFASSSNDTLADQYLDAEDAESFTHLTTIADAQAEADRRQALYGTKREMFAVPLANGLFQYNVGEVWTLQVARFGLSTGRPCVITGITENVVSEELTLEMWG